MKPTRTSKSGYPPPPTVKTTLS
uniref:Uncharacterized protein n=1 Tax=Anguilla anguilla TaxID=7936 RepID=A0A0E9P9V3_ANGAN